MAFDYAGLKADTVDPLLEEFGRAVTLTRRARTVPVAKPWLTQQGDAAAAPAQSVEVVGVRISRESAERGGTITQANEAVWLITAPDTLPEELGADWQLVDGTATFEVKRAEPLRPAGVLMLYRMVVAL